MNSIWLILLLLCCCNGDNGFGRSGCGWGCGDDTNCGNNCIEPRNTDCGHDHRDSRDTDCGCDHRDTRDTDCGCDRRDTRDKDYDYEMRMSPFSPLNRRERMESDYSNFRGNNGPCGCEENDD